MEGLVIDNEWLAERLRHLAEQENLSVEDLLIDLLDKYQRRKTSDPVKRLRRLAYERARRYWRETGDEARSRLTDEQLDEQFLMFDEDDIPRLKSDEPGVRPSPLARLAALAREAQLPLGDEAVSPRSDEILGEEFADYLSKRMGRQDHDADS